MRVLYFHQHFSTPKGSVGIRSYEMARRLIERGHAVTMVCGSYGGGETGLIEPFVRGCRRGKVDGIHIVEFDLKYSNSDGFFKRSLTFFRFAWRSISLVFTERYDMLFATTTPLTAGLPGVVARWLRRKPFVFEVRDLWPELPKAMGVIRNRLVLRSMSMLEWVSYRSAHRLIGLAPGIVEGIVQRGVPQECVTMIPNGCDMQIFSEKTNPWRPESVSNEDLLAVYAGTHGLANGLHALLAVAEELRRRGRSDIKLMLVGQGKLKFELQRLAASHKLDNLVFHEPVCKIRLAGLMAEADIGLQILANVPAFYNGTSPNKFFDYIAAGVPVITNYPGWIADLITENNCGYEVPPDSPEAFADALEHLADDRSLCKLMGQHARKLAMSYFDRTTLADRWVDWVESTCP